MAVQDNLSPQPTFFARQATGLVREAGLMDMVMYNAVENTTLGVGFAFGVSYILVALVGANLIVAQLIATVFGLFVVTTWGLLSSAIPRSGGDYVLNSRILSPMWSFVGSWGLFVANLVFAGTVATWMSQLMLSPAFAALGMVTRNKTLTDWGSDLAGTNTTFVVGTILLILTGAVAMLGIKAAMRLQVIMVIVGMIGFLSAFIAMLFFSHSSFVSNFNHVAQPYTHHANTYNYYLSQAKSQGLSISFGHTVEYTLVAFFAIQGLVANSFWSAYVAGEVKGVRNSRRQVGMMLLPVVVTGTLLTLAFVLLFNRVGYDFVTSVNYISGSPQYGMPAPPYSSLLVAMGTNNAFVTFLVGFGLCGWGVAMALGNYLFMSRMLFAWSFDRIVPLKISEVNDRVHSPVIALGIVFVGSELALWIYAFKHSQITSFVASYFLIGQLALALVGLSGVLFPYIRKQMYENSPAKLEFMGIPVITIAGVVTLLGEIGTTAIYFHYPTLGLPSVATTAEVLLIPLAIGVVIFLIAKYVRQSQGIDINALYKEIPPE